MGNTITGWGIRSKLIAIFVVIKVIPLLLLGWVAWHQAQGLGDSVAQQATDMADEVRSTMIEAGDLAVADAVKALDLRSRESIERLSTDTARRIAEFLYDRDRDILMAADLPPDKTEYRLFMEHLRGTLIQHQPWVLKEDKSGWRPAEPRSATDVPVSVKVKENAKEFHYRPPEAMTRTSSPPLYLEITFVDLDGRELVKIGGDGTLEDVSDPHNTWFKAERYFNKLQNLKNGEIYVSDVIGAYVPSKVIGPYTPKSAEKAGIEFKPETSAYAGKENPVGKRFKGIIRWATPVVRNGTRIGYVTMALDHDHIMAFTDHLVPTDQRYSDISDASSGNYAFMWDYKGRNISHPRDYFIVGYDPETGEPAVPWLSQSIYKMWQDSGKSWGAFEQEAPRYLNPGSDSKPAKALIKQGQLGLDCRFLNFAPQCTGWHNLTQHGGSGSFVIFWSGLWKLTTAATIPYYTGQYGATPRGFGFVTIGANVDEFHKAATQSGKRLTALIEAQDEKVAARQNTLQSSVHNNLKQTSRDLALYTIIMIIVVIAIAVWLASLLTGRVTTIIDGISTFQKGDLSARLHVTSKDELGQLSEAFNGMAADLQNIIQEYEFALQRAEESDRAKSEFLANMSHELRTPLNAVLGFSDSIRHEIFGPVGVEAYRGYANDIHESGEHLLEIINDILDLSRVSTGNEELRDDYIVLDDIVQSTLSLLKNKARDSDIALHAEVPPTLPLLKCDPRRIKQVLINLLSNAIKFTPEGGTVTLKAWVEDNDEFKISVNDTGIGMKMSEIPTALKPFGQVDGSLRRKYEGTGLGLPLSKAYMSMHGGKLWIETEPGQGTTITLTFPADRTFHTAPE